MKSAVTVSLVEEARGGPFVFWSDLPGALRDAQALGFDAIEIFPPDAGSIDREPLKQMLSDHNLAVAAFGTGAGWVKHKLQLADSNATQRQKAVDFIRSIMDLAADFGASAIIGSMQGRSGGDVDRPTANGYLREGLALLGEHAARLKCPVLYEPLNRYETDQANTLEAGFQLIRDLPNVRLLADWFHMNIEEVDLAKAFTTYGKYVGHVHFADTNRSAIGLGHLDVAPIIDALRAVDYQGYLSAEVFPKPNSLAAAQQSIRSFRHHVLGKHEQ